MAFIHSGGAGPAPVSGSGSGEPAAAIGAMASPARAYSPPPEWKEVPAFHYRWPNGDERRTASARRDGEQDGRGRPQLSRRGFHLIAAWEVIQDKVSQYLAALG